MRTPSTLSPCIGRMLAWPIRLFTHSQHKRTLYLPRRDRSERLFATLISALLFPVQQQGKPVPVQVALRRQRAFFKKTV